MLQVSQISLVDIGVNLMSPSFNRDRDMVLASARAAGVKTLIITGSSIESSREASDFARTHEHCMATAGVHPHNAKTWDAAAQAALLELVSCPTPHSPLSLEKGTRTDERVDEQMQNGVGQVKASVTKKSEGPPTPYVVVAIGECGLDYNRNFSPPQAQRKCFEDQLALAAQLGKPVFLHTRDAFDDFLTILKQYRTRLSGAVVHCFTGLMAELEAYLALDCYIGITGWVCDERRGGHLIPLLHQIPPDRLLLETDAPYLLPRNLAFRERGQRSEVGKSGRNEPKFLPHIAAFIANLLGKTPDQLAAETSVNAARLFNFSG
jgi:TatD DNase family protein